MGVAVFDFGGSAVKYGVWDEARLVHQGKFPTPPTWEEMKEQLATVFTNMASSGSIEGVGISAPGVVDAKKQQINGISAIPYIHGFNIYQELEELFHVPVTIENDANCAGMAEFYEGAAKEEENAAFVVVGTGIGGALFTKGELNKGSHLYGGEFGLMFLDGDQTFSLLGTAVQMAWRYCDRMGVERGTYSGEDVFELAERGEQAAREEVEKFYLYLTRGLFGIQFSFDPEVIVIGGGVSAKPDLIEQINSRMAQMTSEMGLTDFIPEIRSCVYQNDANLIGAAANFAASKEKEEVRTI